MVEEREEVWSRIGKCDLKGSIIQNAEPDFVELVDLSFVKCLGVYDWIQHVCNRRSQ
jgi:hypothetical protein